MRTGNRKCTLGVRGLVWEAYVPYWSGFPLHGVHQFELSQLSDMSNSLFVAVFTLLINDIMYINELMACFTNYLYCNSCLA
jgi:hypothetical protein